METNRDLIENILAEQAIAFALKIHSKFGAGLLESAYQECLAYELIKAGFKVEKEKSLPLIYEDVKLERGYRLDLLVDDKLVIEIKAVEEIADVHFSQVLTYLRVGNYKLGLILNFNVARMKFGIRRVANGL